MKLSVIVPVFNMAADGKLEYCLNSLINQTIADYEIIAVDDCSTDNSLEILHQYAEQDARVIVFEQTNQGSGAARNLALREAKGEYVVFLDCDDFYPSEETLEIISSAIQSDKTFIDAKKTAAVKVWVECNLFTTLRHSSPLPIGLLALNAVILIIYIALITRKRHRQKTQEFHRTPYITITASEKQTTDPEVLPSIEIPLLSVTEKGIRIDKKNRTAYIDGKILPTTPMTFSIFLLLSENIENLVQTIQSRCVKYRINYFGSENYDFMFDKAAKVADMILNRQPFYKVKKEVDDIMGSSEETAAFLDGLQVVFRNMLIEKTKGISLYKNDDIINNIHAVETARKQIKEGVSTAYAMKNLLLKIGG